MVSVDVFMVGNFAKDRIIVDGLEEITSGGGVYFGSVVIRRLGYSVAVATRLHPQDFQRLEELEEEGVLVYATPADGTSGIANYYRSADMERRICKPIGFGGKYSLAEIPDLAARVIMITPLFSGEVDLDLLRALSARAPLALDVQGFVRVPMGDRLDFQPWGEMSAGLALVKLLKVDRAEAEHLTGLSDPEEAARALSRMGPKEIVLTESAGVHVYAYGEMYFAPFNPRSLIGRTGRGDTCFSTYVAKRLDVDPQTACRWAGVVTSLKQEKPGPWKGNAAEVEAMLAGGGS
jgi:sugar/nucleoside kinase (ribokinase family)